MALTPAEFAELVRQALADESCSLPEPEIGGEFEPLARLINDLLRENRDLRRDHRIAVDYIRDKINQMLVVIGTVPLRTEELDENTLITLDPLGIISRSFTQILDHSNRTNRKLSLARDEIQAIFESVGGGLLVLDADRKILSCNRKFRAMFKADEENIIGKRCYEVVCGKSNYPARFCAFRGMMQSGDSAFQPDWHRNGRHYRIEATPIKDRQGKVIRCVVLYVDITELVEARLALDDEKERLATTLESIAEGVIATNKDGLVTMMNKVAEKLTGWQSEEVAGRTICSVMNVAEGSGGRSCRDFFRDVLSHREMMASKDDDMSLVDRHGNRRTIYLSAAPIHQHDRTVAGTIVVFRDITAEKRIKEELAKATKLESLGVFAGGIAHDFNNLLTGVLGNVSLAKALAEGEPEISSLLDETEKISYRARNLTQQLLTFAKGGAPVKSLISIRDLLAESVEFCLRGSNVRCDLVIPGDIRPVEVDEGQIGQVIQNLVINAAQAMPSGGLLEISAENVEIDRAAGLLLTPGSYVQIAISDYGEGIDKQNLDKIFDPFFTTKKGGSGLGLATSYSIVSKHHGEIAVESTPGLGTTFFVYLPASARELKVAEEQPAPDERAGGTGLVLVMDDEELIRTVAEAMLGFGGFRVELARDGREAVEKYKNAKATGAPFDVVLMDLTIPGGMGGKEAMAELRAFDPEAKGIVSSGYANDPIMADFKQHGFCGVIPKPYKLEELNRMVAEIIGGGARNGSG